MARRCRALYSRAGQGSVTADDDSDGDDDEDDHCDGSRTSQHCSS